MKKNKFFLLSMLFTFLLTEINGQSLFLQENAAIYIQENTEIQAGGSLINNGFIENLGTLSIYEDFLNNSLFNSTSGALEFRGDGDQWVFSPTLNLKELNVDGENRVTLTGDSVLVFEEMNFTNGILTVTDTTELIISNDVNILGGNSNSYFDGELIQLGNSFKKYPLGKNGLYAPITLDDIIGIDLRMRVSVNVPANDPVPVPAADVIGVSEHAIWNVNLDGGSFDSAVVSFEFSDADLENFTIENSINADFISPVVVAKNSLEEEFNTLGVSSLLDTDSLTFGTITAEKYLKLTNENKKYLAIGKAPIASRAGLIYIPNVFSPNAIEEENQTFRIFGNRIINEGFSLRIFNQRNVLLYQTDAFDEANQFGWNGIGQNNGSEQPSGLYYYTIVYQLEGGVPQREQGAFYLIR